MITPIVAIRQALYGQVQEIGSRLGVTGIAWPNAAFKATRTPYLRPSIHYSDTSAASLGSAGFERIEGFLQITLVGETNTGEGMLDEMTQVVIDMIRAGTRLPLGDGYPELIVTKTYRSTLLLEGNRPTVVVTVNFTVYAPKGD